MKSENTNELAAALAKAQSKIIGALKDSSNPFFKSNYADLASVWDAIRIPLSENGLSVSQQVGFLQIEDALHDTLTTTLLHSSGQWVESVMHLRPVKPDPQALGSCITYARRYALAAITGCPQIDDDGNEATKPVQKPTQKHAILKPMREPEVKQQPTSEPPPVEQKKPALTEAQIKRLFAIATANQWGSVEVKQLLKDRYSISSSNELSRVQYDDLCAFLQRNKPDMGDIPH